MFKAKCFFLNTVFYAIPIPYPFALKTKYFNPSQGKWSKFYTLP